MIVWRKTHKYYQAQQEQVLRCQLILLLQQRSDASLLNSILLRIRELARKIPVCLLFDKAQERIYDLLLRVSAKGRKGKLGYASEAGRKRGFWGVFRISVI